jgi:hypothetical protein
VAGEDVEGEGKGREGKDRWECSLLGLWRMEDQGWRMEEVEGRGEPRKE